MSDNELYKVETVPPPDGESDAYNAPTRVGQMAPSIAEMMKIATETGTGVPNAVPPADASTNGAVTSPPPKAEGIPTPVPSPLETPPSPELSSIDEPAKSAAPAAVAGGTSASYEPMQLTAPARPMFSRTQWTLIACVMGAAAIGIYLLFR